MEFISKHHVSKLKVKQTYIPDLWLTVTVHDQQKPRWLSLTFYRGITVGIASHPHGNPVRRNSMPAVLP